MKKLLTILFLLFTIPAYSATYYVKNDGDDTKDGLSDTNAWKTIAKVNASTFSAGDTIILQDDDVFTDALIQFQGGSAIGGNITYKRSGNGTNKPIIQTSIEANNLTDWTDEGGNIWSNNNAAFTVDVGNIIFNNGSQCGIKVWNEVDLDSDLEFWYDSTNHLIKIYSAANPASRFTDIECAIKYTGKNVINNKNYIVIDGLQYQYNGNQAIFGTGYNITIRNCDFRFNGGCQSSGTVRFGGGIGTWNSCSNWLIEKCTFDNEWDTGLTVQGTGDNVVVSNIVMRNNIISNCHFGFEYFESGYNINISNIYFEHNTIINTGSGWSDQQRTDLPWAIRIGKDFESTHDFFIRNNIIYDSTNRLLWKNDNALGAYTLDYNCWYKSVTNTSCWYWGTNYNFTQFAAYQSATGQDAHSITQDPLLSSRYRLLSGSPAINAGATGLNVTDDYLGNPRDAQPDIGSYEAGNFIKSGTLHNATLN